jgi:hypothetical protein
MELLELGFDIVFWFYLTENSDELWAVVNTVMNVWLSSNKSNTFSRCSLLVIGVLREL